MLDTLLSGPIVPFTLSLALLFALLAVELLFLALGASLIGDGVEGDMAGLGDGPEIDLDLDGFDVDPAEFDIDVDVEPAAMTTPASSPLSWLGLGKMPTLIWLATIFLSFGVTGLTIQSLVSSVFGAPLPAIVAVIPSAIVALWFTGRFGALFARLLPRTETQSVSQRHLGRRAGTVTQGTARRGTPAEVRVTDRHGNTHYLRAEPFRDADEIPEGADVLVIRHRPTGGFRLIPL
jgi:hypothetical protein